MRGYVAMTYPSGVDRIVEAAKLLDHKVDHGLDRVAVLNIHLKGCGLILLVASILLTLL